MSGKRVVGQLENTLDPKSITCDNGLAASPRRGIAGLIQTKSQPGYQPEENQNAKPEGLFLN